MTKKPNPSESETPQQREEVGLAPCPFCGAHLIVPDHTNKGTFVNWVMCSDCGCEGPYKDTLALAIEAWNKRVPLPQREGDEYGRGVTAGKMEALKYTPEERERYGKWAFGSASARAHQDKGEMAEALMCMENGYNHLENALRAEQKRTPAASAQEKPNLEAAIERLENEIKIHEAYGDEDMKEPPNIVSDLKIVLSALQQVSSRADLKGDKVL
jgi:Lar family restriction alleviation protein